MKMLDSNENILTKIKFFAENTPDKICLIEAASGAQISYADFWEQILRYASTVAQDKYYILQTRQTIKHFVAFYGVQMAGSVAIPVEAATSAERLAELSKQFDAEILPAEYILPNTKIAANLPDSEKIACVIVTSGTTGKNKGVLSSFRCRFCGADNVRCAYEISADDIAFIPQIFSHSGGLRRVETMFVSGATAVIASSVMFFGNVFKAIKKYNCNILQFVPAQVSQILQRAEKLLSEIAPQIKIVGVGSAAILENDKEKLRQLLPGARLFNEYGATEAIGSAYFEWSAYPPKPNCIGAAGIHSKIVFVDNDGNLVENTSRDFPAIIATEGGTLMSGYLNDSKLTAEVMKGGRVISADLGYLGEDGFIYILGRKDDIINSGGNKISPVEIENVVLQLNGVKECACVPKADKIMGQMPALFIVWEKDFLPAETVIAFLAQKIDKFKIPRAENIYSVESFQKTPGTGKIIKHLLTERLNNEKL